MEESEDVHTVECSTKCGHDYHEHMDVTDTGDASLTKLYGLVREYDVENIFPPLDGTALFSMLCKINHSCEPNVRVKYVFTKELGLTAFLVALKEIHKGSELLQSYIDQTMGT
jgi:SET domain